MSPADIIQFPKPGREERPRVAFRAPGFPPFDLASKAERAFVREVARQVSDSPAAREHQLLPHPLAGHLPEGVSQLFLVGFIGWCVGAVYQEDDSEGWRALLAPFDCYGAHTLADTYPTAQRAATALIWGDREGLARPLGTWPDTPGGVHPS